MKPRKTKNQVSLYFYGEDQLYIKELVDRFRLKTNYAVNNYTSWLRLIASIPANPLKRKGIHIVLLAFNFDAENTIEGKTGYEILHEVKILSHDIEAILISKGDDSELQSFVKNLPGVTLIRKNENSFMRIRNNIKRIRSAVILEKRRVGFRLARNLIILFVSLVLIAIVYLYFFHKNFLLA